MIRGWSSPPPKKKEKKHETHLKWFRFIFPQERGFWARLPLGPYFLRGNSSEHDKLIFFLGLFFWSSWVGPVGDVPWDLGKGSQLPFGTRRVP